LSQFHSTFFHKSNQVRPGIGAAYRSPVLGRLQDRRGAPAMRTRAMAVLVIVGMVVLTAPLVVVPIVRWIAHHLL
jgi:hypothetical protein